MTEQNTQTGLVFNLEKIYIKDSSFEVPGAPQVYLDAKSPEVGVQLGISHSQLNAEQGLYEVVLAVTVTAKNADKIVFLAEAHQAGLFHITGMPEPELPKILEIACPNVLLPFVRQAVNNLIESGGFPQLLLSPINFEALYLQKQAAAPQAVAH
ncbi:MAG: secB [Proteobacteria bacterium]|jgi:preprotein translocase subunit SecB|nr:secB [Pseudomonadota bacterium]MBS1245828.1 secB [Pseudomonadota bacterium]